MANGRLRTEIQSIFGRRRSLRSATPSLPVSLSHYKLSAEISTGARSNVYLARDCRLDRLVAVKILHPKLRSCLESKRRFLREAICASTINHPNIVTVYELDHHQGTDFIVMEYVRGTELSRVIPKQGLPIQTCLRYAHQIACALTAIHSHGIVHRDLKPANFMIAQDGTVKLLDFGVAKLIKGRHRRANYKVGDTIQGTILGTAGYMSPEQARGIAVDQRSDIFSFGAILYELLSGRRAFQEPTTIQTMSAILQKAPPKLPKRVPESIATICDRCLAKRPHQRYGTAADLVEAILRVKVDHLESPTKARIQI